MVHIRAYQNHVEKLVKCLPMDDTHFIIKLSAQQLLPGDTENKIKTLSTQADKASYFLNHVIKPALDINETSCFDKLLCIMQECDYIYVQKLAVTIKCEINKCDEVKLKSNDLKLQTNEIKLQAKETKLQPYKIELQTDEIKLQIGEIKSKPVEIKSHVSDRPDAYIEKFKDEDVVCAFAYLFNKLRIMFDEVNFTQLKNACIQRGTRVPSEFKQQIKAANKLDDLLDVLDNPVYCNWLNICLLKRIVKTIDIPEAKNLIQAYESCVYSRKVSDVEIHFHSDYFKPSHVSLVNAKIMKSFTKLTVADIIKYCERLESNMGVCAGSVTATECQPGCLQITCVIPLHCALHAYETAKTNFLKFRQSHIQYIEIKPFPKVFAVNFQSYLNTLTSGPYLVLCTCALYTASEDSSRVISHYYTCLENYMDADSVSHMMHCEHLITDDDYEAITAAPNDNIMNTLLLQYVRLMNVNQLSKFCNILKSIEAHKIIEDCSSLSFQALLQKLSTKVRVPASKQLMASSIECMKISEVNVIFYDLIDHLYLHLSVMEKLPFDLNKYRDINPLFTEKWLKKIKSLYFFKIYLLPFITWLDHSILKELVVASGSEDAQQLLNWFDSKIKSYCSQPITSFPILSPSQLMIPLDDSEYTLLAMKFCLPSRGDTNQGMIILQDVMDIKLMMKHEWKMNNHEISNIQLIAVHAKLELLYWMIPKCLVKMIKSNLVHNWRSGIIMMAVLPANFYSLDNNSEMLKGPLSSLNSLWQDDPEVLNNTSLQNKLENIDTQNLAQQYLQLHDSNKEEKTVCIQLRHEISEITSHIKVLEKENVRLKEECRKVTKHFGQKSAIDEMSTSLPKEPKSSKDSSESLDRKSHQCQNKLSIHQLMNIIPFIQEKWSLIGTRLKLSSDKLDDIWHTASEQQIPAESKNTFCCVKMLTSWHETSDDVSIDDIMMAIDAPHVGLKSKITNIETVLRYENATVDGSKGKSIVSPPEQIEQSYFDMVTKFCLELSKSQYSISDILTYLKICNVNSDVVEEIHDFAELVKSFERHELLNKSDLTWLKNIARHAQCAKAIAVVEEYESLLMADKIPWHSSHQKGTYLVGRTDKKPGNVTIKDGSNAKSAASRIVNINDSDSVLDSTEVGSVTFYWRLVNKAVGIKIPMVADTSLIRKCRNAGLTHIGIMIDGNFTKWNAIGSIGIKSILISPRSQWEEYICPDCDDLMNDPIQTSCGHRVCYECFDKRRSKSDLWCPVRDDDGQEHKMSQDDWNRDRTAKQKINKLLVKCKECKMECAVKKYRKFDCSTAHDNSDYHTATALPTKLSQKTSSTEELNTLHAWPSDPRRASPAISREDQRDLQQISQFREQIEREIEEVKYQIRKMGQDSNHQQEYEQIIQDAEKKILTKEAWRIGRMRFSKHPSDGIGYLIEHNLLNHTAEDIAVFLYESNELLNKVAIGEYLGSGEDFNKAVLRCFVQLQQFNGLDLVNALRMFLKSFVLLGESQQNDRMIETFAIRYCSCNPGIFSCTDTCYVLSFSIIMLNTALHNPNVKDKPSLEKFIMMNKGLDDGQDLPRKLLMNYYSSIKRDPLPWPENRSDLAETFFSPDHQGWLVKEGAEGKNWKRRWFVLTDNCLYYFKSPQDERPRGIIPLVNLQVRDVHDPKLPYMIEIFQEDLMGSSMGTIKSCKMKDTNKAVVMGNHEVYRLQGQNENDKALWMKKIKASIHKDPFLTCYNKEDEQYHHKL